MELKEAARQRFDEVYDQLREISRWMYHHPEVAFQEHESSRRLVEFLGSNGFEVEYPAYGLETAFAAGQSGKLCGISLMMIGGTVYSVQRLAVWIIMYGLAGYALAQGGKR